MESFFKPNVTKGTFKRTRRRPFIDSTGWYMAHDFVEKNQHDNTKSSQKFRVATYTIQKKEL